MMKAVAMFPPSGRVALVDHPEPVLTGPDQVKVKILEVGVCGTDREIWAGDYGTPPPGSEYLVTGHESLGRVVEVGSRVLNVKPGDLVIPTVRRGCPEQCPACANRQPDFCFTGHFTERGIKEAHGYMTEFIVDGADYMNPVPEELRDVAVLLEPLTITEKALIQIDTIQSRLPWTCRPDARENGHYCRNALVLGAGPVGILAALALKNRGFGVGVVARAKAPNAKTDLLGRLDIPYFSTEETTPAAIAARYENLDVIVEATGAARVSYDFMGVLGVNGIFIFTGVPGRKSEITLDAAGLMRNMVLKNQAVLGTVNAPKVAFENGVRSLTDFSRNWPRELRSLITGRLPIRRFNEALDARSHDEIKTILTFEDRP